MNDQTQAASSEQGRRTYPVRRLYRDPDHAPLFGVCTGIAQYLAIEPWITRTLCVIGVLFAGSIVIPAYIVAIFIMDKKPDDSEVDFDSEANYFRYRRTPKWDRVKRRRKKDAKNSDDNGNGMKPRADQYRLRIVAREIEKLERKLQRMETFITSGRYELEKEFQSINT